MARVVFHQIRYEWDGAVGNTSDDKSGAGVHFGFWFMRDLTIRGTKGFYCSGYNEGNYDFRQFDTRAPQKVADMWAYFSQIGRTFRATHGTYDRDWRFTASDEERSDSRRRHLLVLRL